MRLELARARHDIRLSGRSARRDDIAAGADCEDHHTIRIEPHQRAATIGTQWRGARAGTREHSRCARPTRNCESVARPRHGLTIIRRSAHHWQRMASDVFACSLGRSGDERSNLRRRRFLRWHRCALLAPGQPAGEFPRPNSGKPARGPSQPGVAAPNPDSSGTATSDTPQKRPADRARSGRCGPCGPYPDTQRLRVAVSRSAREPRAPSH
jgi:hypothetical protein